jgi:hypothetical protein
MFRLETVIAIIVDVVRTFLVEAVSERLTGISGRFRRGPRGMAEVRRHVHRECRQRLRSRLST